MAYVRTPLGRWFYEEAGASSSPDAPTLVLLHSYLCDGSMWQAQVPALAPLGRVVVFDGPGHGKSEVPPPFQLEQHADALVGAFDDLGIKKAALVGLSWGGMVAMRVALAHSQRVAALALLNTSARVEPLKNRLRYRTLLEVARYAGIPDFLVRREVAPKMYGRTALARSPGLVAAFSRAVNGYPREGLFEAGKAVMVERTAIDAKLRSIQVPTLVVGGEEDRATPPSEARVIAAAIARARLVVLPACGHLSTVEQPDAVNALLREHLEPLMGRTSGTSGPHGAS